MTDRDRDIAAFAHRWRRAIFGMGFVPLSAAETEAVLAGFADRLVAALSAGAFDPTVGHDIGTGLVDANFTDPGTLEATLTLLPELCTGQVPARIAAVQATVAAGYARALRLRTMTEQERLSESIVGALRASEQRFHAVFAGSALGIAVADVHGRIVDVNQALADMLGHSVPELRRRAVASILPPDCPTAADEYARLARGEIDHLRLDKVLTRRDGGTIWAELTVSVLRDERGAPAYLVSMVGDITERHLLQERLRYQALHDPLTGLANRRLFAEQLEAAFLAATPTSRVGLCFIDLDQFKYINDSLGHEVGDRLLAAVGRRLQTHTAQGHLVARIGGDEFVILVPRSAGVDQLVDLARQTLAVLAEPVHIGPHRLRVNASIGVVEQAAASTAPSEIVKAGDITLQWAKTGGRGRWALFDRERHARQTSQYRLAAAMAAAIENDEFAVDYQPLVGLSDGSIRGVEALVRWRHPTLGRLGPEQFIGVAEETGLIVPLGRWVLQEATRQAVRWLRHRPGGDFFVSVNVAVPQVREPDLAHDVTEVLAATGLNPGHLQLELTESAVMTPAGQPLENLRRLAAMGIRIAIDDFGTGYSNLAYLRTLPVHGLKLAGTFVTGLREPSSSSEPDEQIVDTLIRLAHALGLVVTAEMVETESQAERLRALGCDLAQGRHLGRPIGADEIAALLQNRLAIA